MKYTLIQTIDSIISFVLISLAAALPFIVVPLTTEIFEIPKLIVLGGVSLLLLVLWSISWVLKGKITFLKTSLGIPLVIFLVIVLLSTWFSVTRNTSIFGSFPGVHGSAISWVVYILFYFILVNNIKTRKQVSTLLYVILGSTAVISILSVFSFFGLTLPFDFARAVNFTPTGSSFSTLAMILMLLPLTTLFTIAPVNMAQKVIGVLLTLLYGTAILFLGNLYIYGITLLLLGLTLFVAKHKELSLEIWYLIFPLGIVVGLGILALFPIGNNGLYQKMQDFPREIQLPIATSWKVAISSFRDRPLLGTGPGTFLFDFTQYKPVEFNQSRFWNVRFGTAFNEFFQMLATMGILGFSILVLLVSRISISLWQTLNSTDTRSNISDNIQETGLLLSVVAAILLLFVHATTLISMIMTFIFLALFAIQKSTSSNQNAQDSSSTNPHSRVGSIASGIALTLIVGFAVWSLWNAIPVVVADYYHSLGVRNANIQGQALKTYEYLARAEQLNPRIDLYRTDLVTVNFALANSLAMEKGPTNDNPERKLEDADKKTIMMLLSQSINESHAAVTLSPLNAGNWEVLASLYGQITGVAPEALQYSLDAYNRAIQLDPVNPGLRLTVGNIYYSLKNYDMASRFFTDSVNLKPDFANGYYNLSIALRDKGDLSNAAAVAEQTIKLLENNKDSQDYKVASEYFENLKGEVAGTKKIEPLQNEDLPDLPVDLKEKIEVPAPEPQP